MVEQSAESTAAQRVENLAVLTETATVATTVDQMAAKKVEEKVSWMVA